MSKTLTGAYVGTYSFEQIGGAGYTYNGQLTNAGTVTGGEGGHFPLNGYTGGVGILMLGGALANDAGHAVTGGRGGLSEDSFENYSGGAGGAGVFLDSGASVVNYGMITGGAGGTGHSVGQAGDGVDAAGVALVVNSGTITGFVGVSGQGAGGLIVANAGTIDGTGGTAVQFGSASDVLVVEAGSTLIGSAVGDGGTLEFGSGGGPGTVTGLGSGALTG